MTIVKIKVRRKGGPGSGHHGHAGLPGQVGGSAPGKVSLSNHAVQRMKERKKYSSVRNTLKKLDGASVPEGEWYCTLYHNDKLDGYLVGVGRVVKTVLGSWYEPENLKGMSIAVKAATMTSIDIRESVAWQLQQLTEADVEKYCSEIGAEPMTVQEFKAAWNDYSLNGLTALLLLKESSDNLV
jgi:hypothetical protein